MARILHLVHSYLPETRGGIEYHVESVVRALASRGHEAEVACGSAGPPAPVDAREPDRVGPARVHRLGAETETDRARAGGRSRTLTRFEEILGSHRPDLLHVHHFAATGPGPVALARRLGIPAVVTLHDFHTICPLFFRLRANQPVCAPEVDAVTCVACIAEASGTAPAAVAGWFDSRVRAFREDLRAAARVFAPSRAALEYLAGVPSFAGIRVECIGFPAGGDLARGPESARSNVEQGAPLTIATWGGLVPGKGLGLLVDAAASLPRGSVRIEHHGPLIDRDFAHLCAERARTAGVELSFGGPYAREALAERVARADIAVHPSSFFETYGLTVDEAHALGLPVVVSDRGAPKERLGGRGRTFRADDARDLARVLAELLDPRERERLASGAAPRLVALEDYVVALEAAYRDVVEEARRQ